MTPVTTRVVYIHMAVVGTPAVFSVALKYQVSLDRLKSLASLYQGLGDSEDAETPVAGPGMDTGDRACEVGQKVQEDRRVQPGGSLLRTSGQSPQKILEAAADLSNPALPGDGFCVLGGKAEPDREHTSHVLVRGEGRDLGTRWSTGEYICSWAGMPGTPTPCGGAVYTTL